MHGNLDSLFLSNVPNCKLTIDKHKYLKHVYLSIRVSGIEKTLTDCRGHGVRLVGGSTIRDGRVEVCVNGRWGTVCNNNQEGIAGAVCSQLGFPAEGILYYMILKIP